jgi:hypothetical protein
MFGVVLVVITAVTVCFVAYLVFCLRLVDKTGDSKSLVHAGTAIRAFGAALAEPLLSFLIKVFGRK